MTRYGKTAFIALGVSLLSLAGCAGYPHHGRHAAGPDVVYVQLAPPPPRTIIIPPRPAPAAVWISGYWDWSGSRYVWVPGRWNAKPPHPGAQWTPDRWVKTHRGWVREPGRWR